MACGLLVEVGANPQDLSKVLGTSCSLHLGIHDIDNFLVKRVVDKVNCWSLTTLSVVGHTRIVNYVMFLLWYFIVIWVGHWGREKSLFASRPFLGTTFSWDWRAQQRFMMIGTIAPFKRSFVSLA